MKHRTFRPEKFFQVVEPEQLQRLLEAFEVPSDLAIRLTLDEASFKSLFDEPNELPRMAELEEETQRINDISEASLRFVVDEYSRAGIAYNADDAAERLALRMYLDFPLQFEAAWSNYALFGTSSDLASYKLVPGLKVTDGQIETFGDSLKSYFSGQGKGEQYLVFPSENAGGSILRIDHGLHMQTLRFGRTGDRATNPSAPRRTTFCSTRGLPGYSTFVLP